MRILPLITLAACASVPPECADEFEQVEEVCQQADVVGTNQNAELYEAVAKFKICAGEQYRLICADDGWTHNLTVSTTP